MRKKLVFALMIGITLILSSSISAQELEEWIWDEYSTSFKAPYDLELTQHDGDGFNGNNDYLALSIYPRLDENLSYEGMEDALVDWVINNGLKKVSEPDYIDDLNGYWGIFVEGTNDGFPVFAMLVVDPDFPAITLYVWLSYDYDYEDIAVEILLSFMPI